MSLSVEITASVLPRIPNKGTFSGAEFSSEDNYGNGMLTSTPFSRLMCGGVFNVNAAAYNECKKIL